MSYGSWSGGIFMLKLNEENGLRDYEHTYKYEVSGTETTSDQADANCTSDPYFGKKIAGGWYVSGEASYIQKIGRYYYLFMSYGGLTANGGYQIRTFRSENPDGPYKDCMGIDAVYNKYILNFGADAKRDEGMKLFGNYQWDAMPTAELAQGHNSAMIDEAGRAMLVYHTRFNDGTEGHQVRVHQLFVNEDGWLLAAPYEFDGETKTHEDLATSQEYAMEDVAGDYQMMAHPYRQNTAAKDYEKPVTIHLNADGTVTGAYTGKWELVEGTCYINLTLNGTATGNTDVTFKGVVIDQTISYTDIPAICFTAVSSSSGDRTSGGAPLQTKGLAIWGSKADTKAAIKYTVDKLQMPISDNATINSGVTLPTAGLLGTNVAWKSSNPMVMTDDGEVLDNGNVTMTLTISNDDYVYTKAYEINVDKNAEATVPVYYPVSTYKNTASGWWSNFSINYYVLEKGKSMQFKFYNYSNKEENYKNWCLYGTSTERGADGYQEYFGVRCDNWDNVTGSNNGCTSAFIWDTFRDEMDGSLVDMAVDYTVAGVFTMKATITTTDGKVYDYAFTKSITSSPSQITLFFVSEGSYIDGSSLVPTGISQPAVTTNKVSDGKWYNLSGQQVDKSYKGIVIVDGKKIVNK